jgi:Co/Zn/Cd efflux system component
MADHCCQHKAEALTQLKQRQARVLWAVLGINLVMFVVEFGAGLRAASLSLTGDSLDMLGDALVYGTSLYVIHRSAKAQAGAALLKGVIMFGFAIAVFARAVYQFVAGAAPTAEIMGVIGLLALAANLVA